MYFVQILRYAKIQNERSLRIICDMRKSSSSFLAFSEGTMDIRNPRDRIWDNLRNAERLSLYYSRRSEQLATRQRRITFVVAFPLLISVALFQLDWNHAIWVALSLLFVTGVCEAAIIHFRIGEDIKASKIKSNQATEVAYQWRKLWIDQNRDNIVLWVELLERMTQQITTESISHSKHRGTNPLNTKCAEDANHALSAQFGG